MFFLDDLAKSFSEAAAEILAALLTWWLRTDSPSAQLPQLDRFATITNPIIATILLVSILAQAIRLMVSRQREPIVDVATGLLRYAVIAAAGIEVTGLALQASDSLSEWMLDQYLPKFVERMTAFLNASDGVPMMRIVLASSLLFFGIIQWLLLFFRQAGILVLAALLPLAASGAISGATRRWLPTLLAWLIGLIVYKPVAAFIYATGMLFVGEGQDLTTVLTGIVILLLAIIALPVMMKFFSWTGLSLSGGGSAGGVASSAATGAASMEAMRSSRGMTMSGPGSAPAWSDQGPTGGGGGTPMLPAGGSGAGSPGGGAGGGGPAGGSGAGSGAGGGGQGGGSGGPGSGLVAAQSGGSGDSASASAGAGGAGAAPGSAGGPGVTTGGGAAGGSAAGGSAAGGAAAGGAAAAAGPAGAAVGAAGAVAGQAAQMAHAAADQMTSQPDQGGDASGEMRASRGPDGAGPEGGRE